MGDQIIQGLHVHQATECTPSRTVQNEGAKLVSSLFTRLSDVEAEQKQYLYKPYFPIGQFSIISADPGVGKTKLIMAIAALITRGRSLLGIECEKPGNVLIFSREDDNIDHQELVRANGGDTEKIITLREDPHTLEFVSKNAICFSSQVVEDAIKQYHPALVVFDPYQKYIGAKTDMNKAEQVSAALSSVVALAKKYDCNITIIAHNTKAQTSFQYKLMGSVDFAGESRSAMTVVRDPNKPDECVLIHTKSNNKKGQSIRYKIESITGNEDFACVRWIGLENYTERDYIESDRSRLSVKIKKSISDEDPIVATILQLIRENPRGFRMAKGDLQDSISDYTGQYMDVSLAEVVKKYAEYLSQQHGIGIQQNEKRKLDRYFRKGSEITPHKNSDRCISFHINGQGKDHNPCLNK